ncbi:MAG: hypothetical protein RMJ39_08690 [Deltaproteobacteria bacterium]|nr:hypothetical protein [Deltaproteobacteria bacterium]
MNRRAISLLSGGLDSLLATKLVLEQGVEVIGLHFTSPFCTCSKGRKGCGIQAVRSARELGIEIVVENKGMDYMRIVESPKYGYGRQMNPCIDCRIYMLKKAKELMIERNCSFVITGEVLDQRPMSQRFGLMRLIEKEAGLQGRVLRPLSGKLLPPTLPEMEGIVERERFLAVRGKGRKVQYERVRSYGLKEFSCPGGGCLLTDPAFSKRVKDLFVHQKDYTLQDVFLLKIGRHIRIDREVKFIVGRNRTENETLKSIRRPTDVLLTPVGFKGPSALVVGKVNPEILRLGATVMAHYAKYRFLSVTVESEGLENRVWTFAKVDFDFERFII